MTIGLGSDPGDGPDRHDPGDPAGELLRSRGLERQRAAVVHFCLGPALSFVGVRRATGRTSPLLVFRPLPADGARLLADLAGVDAAAGPLLTRLADHLPGTVARLEERRARRNGRPEDATAALAWLFEVAGVLLDLDPPDLAAGLRAAGPSLRLDTVVARDGDRLVVDGRRLLRSVVSYRLAGVPRHVLARSVYESLGTLAAEAVRRLLREWPAQLVVCSGDLYADNPALRGSTTRGLVGVRLPVVLPAPAPPPAQG